MAYDWKTLGNPFAELDPEDQKGELKVGGPDEIMFLAVPRPMMEAKQPPRVLGQPRWYWEGVRERQDVEQEPPSRFEAPRTPEESESYRPRSLATHEQSETIQTPQGEWVNVYGRRTPQAGQQLPGTPTYRTLQEAEEAAKRRSREYVPHRGGHR